MTKRLRKTGKEKKRKREREREKERKRKRERERERERENNDQLQFERQGIENLVLTLKTNKPVFFQVYPFLIILPWFSFYLGHHPKMQVILIK